MKKVSLIILDLDFLFELPKLSFRKVFTVASPSLENIVD